MNRIQKAFKNSKTDKAVHKYYIYYDDLFGNLEFDSVLEIGVLRGRSLRAWQQVWPQAVVEGVDINLKFADKGLEEHFKLYELDTTEEIDRTIFTRDSYDLIVDDGDHHWSSQRRTFEVFFPMAKHFYVIEDLRGLYGLQKVMDFLPDDVKKKAYVFDSRGPKVTFRYPHHIETCEYKLIIIDKR